MKPIAHVVLLSTVLFSTACTEETVTRVPDPASPPTAGQQEPAATPEVPAAQAPAAKKASEPVASASVADLPKVLAGITDAASAETAKAPLDAIVQQLESAKAAAPAVANKDPLGGIGKLAGGAAQKLGVSADTVATIATLLENPAVKAVIGPTLEKLQGLLK